MEIAVRPSAQTIPDGDKRFGAEFHLSCYANWPDRGSGQCTDITVYTA